MIPEVFSTLNEAAAMRERRLRARAAALGSGRRCDVAPQGCHDAVRGRQRHGYGAAPLTRLRRARPGPIAGPGGTRRVPGAARAGGACERQRGAERLPGPRSGVAAARQPQGGGRGGAEQRVPPAAVHRPQRPPARRPGELRRPGPAGPAPGEGEGAAGGAVPGSQDSSRSRSAAGGVRGRPAGAALSKGARGGPLSGGKQGSDGLGTLGPLPREPRGHCWHSLRVFGRLQPAEKWNVATRAFQQVACLACDSHPASTPAVVESPSLEAIRKGWTWMSVPWSS